MIHMAVEESKSPKPFIAIAGTSRHVAWQSLTPSWKGSDFGLCLEKSMAPGDSFSVAVFAIQIASLARFAYHLSG